MQEDIDALETREWLDALDSVVRHVGKERATFLLKQLSETAADLGIEQPAAITTPYRNTIPVSKEVQSPGDAYIERNIRSFIRWNAIAMVVRANQSDDDLGGHLASFSSAATLYEVGFNHFFRGSDGDKPGDLVYFQGHSSPGMYARSFLEGRLTEEQLDNFRREEIGRAHV